MGNMVSHSSLSTHTHHMSAPLSAVGLGNLGVCLREAQRERDRLLVCSLHSHMSHKMPRSMPVCVCVSLSLFLSLSLLSFFFFFFSLSTGLSTASGQDMLNIFRAFAVRRQVDGIDMFLLLQVCVSFSLVILLCVCLSFFHTRSLSLSERLESGQAGVWD